MQLLLIRYKTVGIPEFDETGTYIIGYNDIREGYEIMTKEDYDCYEPDAETMDSFKVVAEFSQNEAYNLKDQIQYVLDACHVS